MIRVVKYNGKNIEFMELIDIKELWMHQHTIRRRINRGWKVEKAFDKPITPGTWIRRATTNEEAKIIYCERYRRGKIA